MSTAFKKALGLPETATDAEVETAITKNAQTAASVAALEATVTVLKAKAEMTDKEKAFLAGKDDPAVCKFMELSAEARAAEIAKASAADESVEIEGRTISKRAVGDDVFAVMKAQAKRISDNEADIAKARDDAATATFAKRASDEFPHLAGSVDDRAAVLKHLSGAPEAVRTAGEAILKAAEASAKFAFSRIGGGGGPDGEANDPAAKLEKMAKDYAKANSVSFAKAMDTVAQTPEGAALYAESVTPTPAS